MTDRCHTFGYIVKTKTEVTIMNPYEKCPVFEGERFKLRLVEKNDAKDLLQVYSDKQAVYLFNGDNCDGDDFHYTTLERMQKAVDFWVWSYENKWFVRWAIVDKTENKVVGTIELFNRQAQDYFNNCGLLRLDLGSAYEKEAYIKEILGLIVQPTYTLFVCDKVVTKAKPIAKERIKALEALGFKLSKEVLIGVDDHKRYGDYYELKE